MADGFELEALVNLYTLFHDQPLAATGISVRVEGWDQRLVITDLGKGLATQSKTTAELVFLPPTIHPAGTG